MFNTLMNFLKYSQTFPDIWKQSTHRLLSGLITSRLIYQINFLPISFLCKRPPALAKLRDVLPQSEQVCLAISAQYRRCEKKHPLFYKYLMFPADQKVFIRSKLSFSLEVLFPTIFTLWWKTCNNWLDLQFLSWGRVTMLNMLTKVVKL